jgi:xanthine dehydrogenase accessory factor
MLDLVRRMEQLLSAREPFVAATVVRAAKPTSVRPGDAALVLADGTIEGFVGGVCAQESVRLHAARVLETGEGVLLRLLPGVAAEEERDGVVVSHNPCLSGGALEIFLDPRPVAPRIGIVGDTPIARALAAVARAADYDVGEPAAGDAALIVASHGVGEEAALADALAGGVPYVALVASPRRAAAVRASLDVDDALRAQLRSPAGLDIGARTPADIAVSILAELIGARRAHAPAPVATAIDPVCGMEVLAHPDTPHLDIDGERLYFCCEGCRARHSVESM